MQEIATQPNRKAGYIQMYYVESQFLVRSSALARSDSLTDDHLKSHVLPDSPAQDVCQQ